MLSKWTNVAEISPINRLKISGMATEAETEAAVTVAATAVGKDAERLQQMILNFVSQCLFYFYLFRL